jgi:hypothetical protein
MSEDPEAFLQNPSLVIDLPDNPNPIDLFAAHTSEGFRE